MARPEREQHRLAGTVLLEQADQLRCPVGAADKGDPGARLGGPDRCLHPVHHVGILAHMGKRAVSVARACAVRIVIGRVADNMVETAGKNRRHLANVCCQDTQPVGNAVDLGIFLRHGRQVGMFLNGGDLQLVMTMRHAQADPADTSAKVKHPAAAGGDCRRE